MTIDSKLRKEYFKEYMRSRRAKLKGVNTPGKGVNKLDLNVNTSELVNTSTKLTPEKPVNTSNLVNTLEEKVNTLEPVNTMSTPNPNVNTQTKELTPVNTKEENVNTSKDVKPCSDCSELKKQVSQLKTEKDKQYGEFWTENEKQKSAHKQKLIELYQKISELENQPCLRNHYSLTELFHQATLQVKQAWTEIRNQQGTPQCYNCHNSQRNHQLAINLLEKYWVKVKRLKGEKNM